MWEWDSEQGLWLKPAEEARGQDGPGWEPHVTGQKPHKFQAVTWERAVSCWVHALVTLTAEATGWGLEPFRSSHFHVPSPRISLGCRGCGLSCEETRRLGGRPPSPGSR